MLQRPGHDAAWPAELAAVVAAHRADAPDALHTAPAGCVLTWRVTQLEISASDVRERVAAGRSIRHLVPDPVLDEINRQGLYRDRGQAQALA